LPRLRPAGRPREWPNRSSALQPQQPRRVLVVDLPQDLIRQPQPVDAPPTLRRHRRGCVVEVLVLRLEEAEIDLVQLVAEDLLRRLVSLRNRVRSEQDPVLVLLEEPARRPRLASELADAGPDLDV